MATIPTIGDYGVRLDLDIKQGSTFGPFTGMVSNPDQTPMDLTSCLVRGQIRKKALDADVVQAFTCIITDAAAGKFSFELSDTETAAIVAGESTAQAASKYVYDMELVDSTGRVIPLMYGNVTMFREVTR